MRVKEWERRSNCRLSESGVKIYFFHSFSFLSNTSERMFFGLSLFVNAFRGDPVTFTRKRVQ